MLYTYTHIILSHQKLKQTNKKLKEKGRHIQYKVSTHPFVVKDICHLKGKISVQFSSVAQSCPTLCDPMNHSTPGLPGKI